VYGPFRQQFNLENPDLALTFIHELAHLIDYWCFRNPVNAREYASLTSPLFLPWRKAVMKTEAFRRFRDAMNSIPVTGYGNPDQSSLIRLGCSNDAPLSVDARKELEEYISAHEFFARNMVDYVCRLPSSHAELQSKYRHELNSERNKEWGRFMHDKDFAIVKDPFRGLITMLDNASTLRDATQER